jgi:serine/threonine-protein kinase
MASPAPDPFIGATLDGKYLITERIGTGGMGTVYKAVHVSLGAPRAIKVMRRDLAEDAGFVERFQNEARVAEGLRHPNLVALYDFARLPDGNWYIVSELVEGETVAALLTKGVRFPPADVAHLLCQLCEGLALAHRKGIVHRDISPDNIMAARGDGGEPVAKLLDFGIAKNVRVETLQTGAGLLFGKVGYASPEQMGLLPRTATLDARSDVFSLAAVGYEMLAGQLPWRKDDVQAYVHDLLVRQEATVEERIRGGVPLEWRDAFQRGLARDRERRAPSMQVLKADISEAARKASEEQGGLQATRTMPGLLGPDATTWRKQRDQKRSPKRLLAALAIGAALLASIGGILLRQPPAPSVAPPSPSESPRSTAETLPAASTAARASAPSASPVVDSPTSSPPAPRRQRPEPAAPPAETRTRPEPRAPVEALPSAAAPTETPPGPGTLKVSSTPPASVVLDGEPKGRTPLSLSALVPGAYALVLTTDDGRMYHERVSIGPGETIERDHRFPGFGSLSITSDVWVEVSVDGGPTYQTPCRIDRLLAGRHVIRAFRPGYRERLLEVQVREGEIERARVVLEKQP